MTTKPKRYDPARLEAVNAVLADMAPSTKLYWMDDGRASGWYATWQLYDGRVLNRRYSTIKGNVYPTWYMSWPHGGTASRALHQLVRWLRDQPIVPLLSWHYWASDTIKLVNEESVLRLCAAGWPSHVRCVLCDKKLSTNFDWWDLDGVSGPCCYRSVDCRQRPAA